MGDVHHHAIIVTSWKKEAIEKAHKKAVETFLDISPVIPSTVNDYNSFFIPPDGSKEGWGESHYGDCRRDEFKKYLKKHSGYLTWVEIIYGCECGEKTAIIDSDDKKTSKKAVA